jgi:hypothetical protein
MPWISRFSFFVKKILYSTRPREKNAAKRKIFLATRSPAPIVAPLPRTARQPTNQPRKNMTRKTYATIEEIKSAVQNGVEVYWQNLGYTVKQVGNGFRISCDNGHSAPLTDSYKSEEFFSIQ